MTHDRSRRELLDWIMYQAGKLPDTISALQELAVRLDTLGFAPLRINLQIRALHPEVSRGAPRFVHACIATCGLDIGVILS